MRSDKQNTPALVFEPAVESDWPAVFAIFRETVATCDTFMFAPDTSEQVARDLWQFNGGDRRFAFVARLNGKVVASAYIKPNHLDLGDHIANAGWMVAKAASGQGIGRRFGEYILDQARALGFHGMQFNVVVASNIRAVALWKSLGFQIVGTVPDAFRHATLGLTPIHIMYRRL